MIRRTAVALMTAFVLLLSACAAIPSDSIVHNAPTEAPDQPNIVFVPQPPVNGAAPEDIVRGFVNAASQGRNYSVARQFLTPAFSKRWDPNAHVLVHDALLTPRTTSSRTASSASISLSVPLTAEVDGRGTYTPTSATRKVPFSLVKVAGQWRISSTHDGIVLALRVFQSTFVPQVLQFWDPSFSRLVPDLRWFRTSEIHSIAQGLLDGPSAPLRDGVTASAFLSRTQLLSASQSGGSALVSLAVPAVPGPVALGHMWQQLRRSLPVSFTDLALVVNGRTVPPVAPPRSAEPDPLPVVLADGRFGVLSATHLTEDAVLGKHIAALRPSAATISSAQHFAAVGSASGVSVVTRAGARTVDRRQGLVAPTVDQRGWTYSAPQDDPTELTAFSASGRPVHLLNGPSGGRLLGIQASPDGTRLLVLVDTPNGSQAMVVGIERGANGAPTGLTSASYPVAVGADTALDATWVDDASVAVLTQQSDGQTVTVSQLGGVTYSLGRLANATQLVGATGLGDLRARSNSGDISVWSSNVWQPAFAKTAQVDLIAVQR